MSRIVFVDNTTSGRPSLNPLLNPVCGAIGGSQGRLPVTLCRGVKEDKKTMLDMRGLREQTQWDRGSMNI